MRSFFDTNVLVYLFDTDAPEKQEKSRILLENESQSGRLVISTQVLQEFYVTATRKLAEPLSAKEGEETIRHLSTFPVIQIEVEHILGAVQRSQALGFSFWDALIVETALSSGSTVLYTEDLQHGQIIEGLEIINPFV
ncbi:MAG: PIN domain-containing protein, partial [Desulfococcaceae bacterium]